MCLHYQRSYIYCGGIRMTSKLHTFTRLHDVTVQKTITFIHTAARTITSVKRQRQLKYLSNLPNWCIKFLFCSKFISCLYMFRAHVTIIRRSKLHYTASGIIKPIGGCLVHETATYWCDDTRGCVMQFWPPDDEHMCSKHVEAWNKLIVKQKFCASSWLITEVNILRCTVSKNFKYL